MPSSTCEPGRVHASLAERCYAACDPENRLTAAQLKKHREAALRRCRGMSGEARSAGCSRSGNADAQLRRAGREYGRGVGGTRARQQLIRALVADIIADIDEATREVVLTIHWRGGQHSRLRVRKPRTGEHNCRTPDEALTVMDRMATRFPDADIAATLNRMGVRTGQARHGRPIASAPSARCMACTLPLGREGWRLAHHARGGCHARGHQPRHQTHKSRTACWPLSRSCRVRHGKCRQRPRSGARSRCPLSQRPPASHACAGQLPMFPDS